MDLNELKETFEFIEDWEERYRILIDLGRQLPEFPEAERTEANRVEGCTSNVWLVCRRDENDPQRLVFLADSDAFIVKGLIALVLMAYSGATPDEIQRTDIREVFRQLGLERNLSPNRRDGFFAMVDRIHELAAEAQAA
ncbi:MAG: SufE family protein [Halorhodospira halophila]|uniref:SufE family protein n=1 Tax=Halorhodospira TaxID=85108 RepID=UPI001911416D|nr:MULTISPECIES: SufE family protein [Halorhodospira]MBK5936418.1 cysteine desufuration protein SufE [Halorhodospira halophila]MBK5943978.1 cysteine desufuration protein SufE [Halorhodospira halophila]MCC3750436.1 SufE family protein [Halorhodospira halophila]MCG5527908.1 SufE family protein [Halorhodospira halophila]MCG5533236.1 SufE family protein [Halorhodospira sp. 9621]